MKKQTLFFLLIPAVLLFGACRNRTAEPSEKLDLADMVRMFADVLTDPETTWQQLCDVTIPFADSLVSAILDTGDTRHRIVGQEWGYIVIDEMVNKYLDLQAEGKDVSEQTLNKTVEQLHSAINQWFHDAGETRPNLWKDQYYESNKSAEMSVADYFHLIVDIPSPAHPEPTLHIFFPYSAESNPALVFREQLTDSFNMLDSEDMIVLQNWHKKNEAQDGFPMYAAGGREIVDMMLQNAVMYILFESEETPEGAPGEVEVACLPLDSFQTLWREVCPDYASAGR